MARKAIQQGNRSKAAVAIRRKKFQESLMFKTDQQLETLQNLVSSVEFSLIEKDVLYGLKQGNQVLEEIHSELNIESVQKLMSDTADGIAYQREIEEILMSRMTADEEQEVQRELEALQAQQQALSQQEPAHQHTKSVMPPLLPDVPRHTLSAVSLSTQEHDAREEALPA